MIYCYTRSGNPVIL